MLEEMGIVPDRSIRERRPRLKTVAHAVMAALRMRRLKDEWAMTLRAKEKLVAAANAAKAATAVAHSNRSKAR
jgi:hypothetical protein